MKLKDNRYTLPDGSEFTEENYWRYIMKDLTRPDEYLPKTHHQERKRFRSEPRQPATEVRRHWKAPPKEKAKGHTL